MLFFPPSFFFLSLPPEMFSFHVWRLAKVRLHISLETSHCYHGLWTLLAATVPPMYTCHSRIRRPRWAHRHRLLGWMWVYRCAERLGSSCVYIEWVEFACLCICVCACVCVVVCALKCLCVCVCVLTQSASWVCSQFTFDCRAKARARNEFWLAERLT